jgi:probable HAF family extracellular repeat protein
VLPAPGLTAVDLSALGGANSHATAINGAGQVVGHSLTAAGEQHAFLWEDGVMYDLGTLGGAASTAIAINDSGQIIGESETRGGATHAVLWTAHHVLYLPQIRH